MMCISEKVFSVECMGCETVLSLPREAWDRLVCLSKKPFRGSALCESGLWNRSLEKSGRRTLPHLGQGSRTLLILPRRRNDSHERIVIVGAWEP